MALEMPTFFARRCFPQTDRFVSASGSQQPAAQRAERPAEQSCRFLLYPSLKIAQHQRQPIRFTQRSDLLID